MTDADLELRLRQWLSADAAATHVPDRLYRRVLDIPATSAPAEAWWHRFTGIPALSASVGAAAVAGVLIATLFFGMFDRPTGTDGEPCNNRQVQQAIDNLWKAGGYRYVNTDAYQTIDPGSEVSFDDPQFVWVDTWVSEGAYLAPDRSVDRPTFRRDDGFYDRGYLEQRQFDGKTYRLVDRDGTQQWVEDANWPTANLAYGYLAAAWPSFSIPVVNGSDWGGTDVPLDLPGTGGCTAATLIPGDPNIDDRFESRRSVALRVDVRTLEPTAILIGPAVGAPANDGATRSTWELTWETPDASEFFAPEGAVPDPNGVEVSFEPTPTPEAPDPAAGAWAPNRLPAAGSATASSAAAGRGRIVAVGSTTGDDGTQDGEIWTSSDGVAWESVGVTGADGRAFNSIAWNGDVFVAVAYRNSSATEGPEFGVVRPEAWVSSDGTTWERAGDIGSAEGSGEVANPGRPVWTGERWVAAGSIWDVADSQSRPAFFVSADGRAWDVVELDDVSSGQLSSAVVTPDGSLLGLGCESPGQTNSGAFGESCYQRPWRSRDGLAWTPGPVSDVYVQSVVAWGDQLVAVVEDSDPTGQSNAPDRLVSSTDGVAWEPFGTLPDSGPAADPLEQQGVQLSVVGDELIALSQATDPTFTYSMAVAWRSADGEHWEPIHFGFDPGTSRTDAWSVIALPTGRLAFIGSAQVTETESAPMAWVEPPGD